MAAHAQSGPAVQHLVLGQAHLLTGRTPNAALGPETYRMAGGTVAYRNRRREADADYNTDVTVGLRAGAGHARRTAANNGIQQRPLWGLNAFAAADGRYFGASLGGWLGRLGYFRGGESRLAHALPQVRARGGRLDGPHAQLDYADEFNGFGNPPLRLAAGLGFPTVPVLLRAGAAIPTLAAEGSEVQLFAQVQARLGRALQVQAYWQPRFHATAPTQLAFGLGYVP
ncbi:hypothetical protein B0919_23625 [Hymenobacter sp. CRA2]|nr:hypothetical protein B0919_23625 [Hymenobacter sp. CRA2]